MNELSFQFALVPSSKSPGLERPVASGKMSIESRQNTSEVALPGIDRTQESGPIGNDKLEKTVIQLNEYIQQVKRELKFSIDASNGRTVIKVIDAETRQTIRQIPSEELLEMASHLKNGEPLGFFEASA